LEKKSECIDGNEAAARVAYQLSEVIAIYPITPASPMAELSDAWSAAGHPNLWGTVPEVIEMQSEAGAAGVLHGAAQKGALATTFTASQGLLLMIPTMYKAAGELLPSVIHVAARTVATHALSIFGDHSDVMATRQTGWAMLAASSVQEAHDFALIAHAAALRTRVPFLHFFDGFRTSHEVARVELLHDDDLKMLIDDRQILEHRDRGLSPDHPVLRGSAQNPDVFFQAREASNFYHQAVPGAVAACFEALGVHTGRRYSLVEYEGAPDAERVVVLMGSGVGAAQEAVEAMNAAGARVGLVKLRLYRPFPAAELIAALPATVRAIAVLDRTKEPGAPGEPLYQDVITALAERWPEERRRPRVLGGRYGLSSKEFTPAMVKGTLDALDRADTPRHFTVGIIDDVTRLSIPYDPSFDTEAEGSRALFYGIGSDGTVGAAKATVKIIGEATELHAQGYFVYDSRKSGQLTVSHLRLGPRPIRATYLIQRANFIAVHQFRLMQRLDVLTAAEPGATVLLNSPHGDETFAHLPVEAQRTIIERKLRLFVVDADRIAREVGLGDRINSVMQPCYFALAGLLPRQEAVALIKKSIDKTYGKRGDEVLRRNHEAVDRALAALNLAPVLDHIEGDEHRLPPVLAGAPDFIQRVTARIIAGEGDLLPVSALPPDGTFPTGSARWEKRMLADQIPLWDPSLCIDCGKCTIVCPHAAIRMKVFPAKTHAEGTVHKTFRGKFAEEMRLSIQVSPDDCTGCTLCVDACPGVSKADPSARSLRMADVEAHRATERARWGAFLALPQLDHAQADAIAASDTVKGSQLRQPLFEAPGACSGCGETPYLKLLTQLFGDRIVVANATGCSSIFGGNLPTTPWSFDDHGRGPAWANSLFEDNAEFGLGMRVALERQVDEARRLLAQLAPRVGEALASEILGAPQRSDGDIAAQRQRIAALTAILSDLPETSPAWPLARRLVSLVDNLARKSVWIVGGDGWAYDIGYGGLDHVLASGRNVNILVLDTEVYSNTGGQASKATPRGALAKFAAAGKGTAKKDLARMAMAYEGVYVAQVALGADDRHTVRAFLEADAHPGPSLILAYSTCIAHGIDLCHSLQHQKEAVHSGYWPLLRHLPDTGTAVKLDARSVDTAEVRHFEEHEERFGVTRKDLGDAHTHLLVLGEEDVQRRLDEYRHLAGQEVEAGRAAPPEKTGR